MNPIERLVLALRDTLLETPGAVAVFLLALMVLLSGCSGGETPPADDGHPIVADTSNRTEVSCPAQTGRTLVLAAIGQSNAAGHLETAYRSTRAINFFRGHCYLASDPLLGGTAGKVHQGSQWVLTADRLLDTGKFDNIILIEGARTGTGVGEWLAQPWLSQVLDTPYRITHFLWHQGEADAFRHTPPADYARQLHLLIDRAQAHAPGAPFYVSVATICNGPPDIGIEDAQRSLVAPPAVLAGPDTDRMGDDFRTDGCHLNQKAQEALSVEWLALLGR